MVERVFSGVFRRVFVLGLALGVVVGCDQQKITDETVRMVTEEQVAAVIGEPGVAVVDVRRAQAYDAGHLPGAIHIFLPDLAAADRRLAAATQIIVYASGNTDPLSTAAAKRLLAMGYANVVEFKGGVRAWTDSGRELVTSSGSESIRPER